MFVDEGSIFVETGNSLGKLNDGTILARVIELAKNEPLPHLSQEYRERIHQKLLVRLELERERESRRAQQRRRVTRVFLAGASTVALAALVLKLVGGLPSFRPSFKPSWTELARAVHHRAVRTR